MTNPIETLVRKIDGSNLWENSVFLNRKEFLKGQGTIDTNIYFVAEGCLRIFLLDEEQEQTIRFGYKNNLIAALDAYILEKPSDLIIQALRKTEVKVVSKRKFKNLIWSSKNLLKLWIAIAENLVYQQMERERDLLTNSPEERYRRVFNRSPQLFQEVPHKYIASYLRMTPETLSRIQKS